MPENSSPITVLGNHFTLWLSMLPWLMGKNAKINLTELPNIVG